MKPKKEKFALLVKSGRLEKGYTQRKLAELTGLSLRSIQRIEKAEVCPRDYTLNVLREILEIPVESMALEAKNTTNPLNKRIILSISSGLLILLLSLAYISQAPNFPETDFEAYLFWSMVLILISFLQWSLWNKQLKN